MLSPTNKHVREVREMSDNPKLSGVSGRHRKITLHYNDNVEYTDSDEADYLAQYGYVLAGVSFKENKIYLRQI